VKPIQIKCPHCKDASELLLESEAHMIVLNCPACGTAMMYYYGKTFGIDESEMSKIQGSLHMTTVQGILKGGPGAREPGSLTAVVRNSDAWPAHKIGAPVREKPFAQDDITNLKIELALTKDVNDFIQGI
jgi:Zn ribbon nucleic-acid-binding protein